MTEGSEIPVDVHSRTDWVQVGATSAVPIERAYDPDTGAVYDATNATLGADPRHLRREFRTGKTRYTLGEPVVVEFRVALADAAGDATWREPIGGNYRARGRDDNFYFALRHADGSWVADPYGPDRIGMGGLSTSYEIARGEPRSYWLAVQRWAAIERPGRYDLYCLHFKSGYDTVGWRQALADAIPAHLAGKLRLGPDDDVNALVDATTGAPSGYQLSPSHRADANPSPLAANIPAALASRLDAAEVAQIADFAHIPIEVVDPGAVGAGARDEAARARMVADAAAAAKGARSMMLAERPDAIRDAILFVRQDDFLDTIAAWLKAGNTDLPLAGLAMHPNPRAVDLLLAVPGSRGVSALYHLDPRHIPRAVPHLLARLTDPDDDVRSWSFEYLARWSGERFGATWQGFQRGRPTVDEARAMLPKIRARWSGRARD